MTLMTSLLNRAAAFQTSSWIGCAMLQPSAGLISQKTSLPWKCVRAQYATIWPNMPGCSVQKNA